MSWVDLSSKQVNNSLRIKKESKELRKRPVNNLSTSWKSKREYWMKKRRQDLRESTEEKSVARILKERMA